MADDSRIILNMPFDEQPGSTVAYDYSKNRADGTVTDCNFIYGKQGNCIEFDGNGYCQIPKNIISLTGNFTLFAWMRRKNMDGFSGKKLGLFIAWNDINGFRETWFNITETWLYFTVVKNGLNVKLYLDTQLIENITLPAQPTGISFLQDTYSTDYGYGFVDEIKAYDVAMTQEEISDTLNSAAQLNYLINDMDILKKWDIHVSDSRGLLDRPKLKPPFKLDWPDYHGQVLDLSRKRVEAREIELDCWMKATGKIDFVMKLNSFLEIFQADGTQRLTVDIHPTKPLLYEIYNESGVSVEKRWNDELMVGTFTLKLTEPDPVKRIIRHQRISEATKTLNITLSSDKAVLIYWGDGEKNEVFGTGVSVSHNYAKDGIYYAMVTGVIEEITNFTSNGITVWNKI
jgi:hypothetical protein